MMSTTTTVTKPSAAIRAKITNVEFVSIGSKYSMKYIILIGEFEMKVMFMGFLYISVSFIGEFVIDSEKTSMTKKHKLAKTKNFPNTY